MIEKPTIVITSIGRTGTEFFAKLFADVIPNSTSLHEPDIFKFQGVDKKMEHYGRQILQAGIWRMVFLKAFGKWTLVNLSDSRFLGNLSDPQVVKKLHEQRSGFVFKVPGSVYIESNLGYYGMLDVMPEVFRNHKAVYIVRDGRDWIRSMLNWGEVYGKEGVRKLFAHEWPAASKIPGDPWAEIWHTLPRFEKLCWAWVRLNEFALNSISKNPNARVFQFEKIFTGEGRYHILDDLVGFVTDLPGINPQVLGGTEGWLEQKIHQSTDQFPAWEQWSVDQKRQFKKVCGPLMDRLGYHI
jgi:hypothetical protein